MTLDPIFSAQRFLILVSFHFFNYGAAVHRTILLTLLPHKAWKPDEEEEMNTKGRQRSAAGGRKLPPLAMGDLGDKGNQKNQGQTTSHGSEWPWEQSQQKPG